jgi:hypothetical protein
MRWISLPPPERRAGAGLFGLLLLGLAGAAGLICARAALGRTGSWSFPIDDAYIYSNYARAAAQGQWLQYNPGEPSGGVTGPAWFLLLTLLYPLTAPVGDLARALAPQIVQTGDPALAAGAGRLFLAAYALGGVLLALAAWGTARLARDCYRPLPGGAWLAGAAGLALLLDRTAIWGAFSGLEIPLSLAVGPWALAALAAEARAGPRLRGSLVLAALLPWARPELAVLGAAGVAWLAWGAARRAGGLRWRHVAQYAAALTGGLLALVLFYALFTGRPLPSSFYAKVGGLRLGERMLAPFAEWVAAGQLAPFLLLVAAALGAGLLLLARWRNTASAQGQRNPRPEGEGRVRAKGSRSSIFAVWREFALTLPSPSGRGFRPDMTQNAGAQPSAAGLTALAAAAFLAAMALTLPWFGQEDRYVLPLHPLLLVLAGGIIAAGLGWRPAAIRRVPRRSVRVGMSLALLLVLGAHLLELRVWAAGSYALYVQNIEDAHVRPARWLAANAPPGVPIASEPIGAVRLFGGHPTVDIVGLTTPALLGTYGDWAATAAALRARHVPWLLFYPRLWPDGQPLPWATEVQRFPVPDNRIAGSDPIAIYRLTFP